ncbi:hypothetical protein P692DRAFT_201674322, partial [Suillus brevipes Sb2]
RQLRLRSLELLDNEWLVVEQLQDALKARLYMHILKDATLFFFRSMPNLATVIPAMDLIDEKLTTLSLYEKFLPSIRAAIALAKKTLNHYYELTDRSEVYRISLVLHPQHKLAYFKLAKWTDK